MLYENDALVLIPGEKAHERLARAYLLMAGCSATVDRDRYIRTVVRPSDRTPSRLPYYLTNSQLSTCQLAQIAGVRIAGVTDNEAVEPYKYGMISADQEYLWGRYGAFERIKKGSDITLFMGDGFWIDDGSGLKVHAVNCISDGVRIDQHCIEVDTVQGGQLRVDERNLKERTIGTTAQVRSVVRLHFVNGWWMLGKRRHVIRILRSRTLPIPTIPAVPDIVPAQSHRNACAEALCPRPEMEPAIVMPPPIPEPELPKPPKGLFFDLAEMARAARRWFA